MRGPLHFGPSVRTLAEIPQRSGTAWNIDCSVLKPADQAGFYKPDVS